MEIQDFSENTSSSYFKEWYGKIIWKGKEIRVRLTISKECDNIEIEKEKMFKILEELCLNQDELTKKINYVNDVTEEEFIF